MNTDNLGFELDSETLAKCKAKALSYVSMAIKTEGQVREYLVKKGFGADDIDVAVDMLIDYDYVNDARYCRDFYVQSCHKGRGRRRIEQDLAQKKIKRSVIKETLDQFLSEENPDYDEIMADILPEKERGLNLGMKLLRQQQAEGKPADKNFLARVGRRLMSQGYDSNVVYSVIGALMKERNDE